MLFGKRTAFTMAGLTCIAAFTIASMSASAAGTDRGGTADKEALYKATHDTDPHIPLTPYQQEKLAQKDQAIVDSAGIAKGTTSGSSIKVATATVSYPGASGVLMNQKPQLRSYWCGPATLQEALGQLGVNVTQAHMAADLGTTTAGTAWSGGPTVTGHPMPDVLNDHQSKNEYFPVYIPPSYSGVLDTYKLRLMHNIYTVRAPLIGDAWTTKASTHHLNGHPKDREIFHWFDIRGYTQSAVYTMYEDSVADSPAISWQAAVPPYSTMESWKIVKIISGRGYVW